MADFDSFNYDIKSRLPEWWKQDTFLRPVNEYTQQLISDILQGLLTTMGVVQPLNCWLSIPEEYDWYHHYRSLEDSLINENEEGELTYNAATILFVGDKMHVRVPNTKRKCHAKIKLKLLGSEITNEKPSEIIDELIIKNADQQIKLYDIPTICTIEISTEDGEILIDGVEDDNLIEGKINKIKPTKKNQFYKVPNTDEDIDLEDENKITEIIFSQSSSKKVNFDLQIYLKKPTYTTEQNIRVASVSAFPIEWIRLYGYFCHEFNNKAGYKFLWEKRYTEESRTVFDRITKQYDCERFCIKVKFYGIETPLMKGFPQEIGASHSAYLPNPNLDKWGRIYNIPRRSYRTDITEEDEPFTFPKYYKYPLEQDYWYEERMVNEYRYDNDAINSAFVKDSDYNNIGVLECIYPFMNDIWVYTETIDPLSDTLHMVQNDERDSIPLCYIEEKEDSTGKEWDELQSRPMRITLSPKSENVLKSNSLSYKSKKLKCSFCLSSFNSSTPQNIEIKGIELRLKTKTNVQPKTIRLSDDSYIIIPYPKPLGYDKDEGNYILEKINLFHDSETWLKEKDYYIIGGEDNLFSEKQITREQLFNGNNGMVEFELGFINENEFLKSDLYIEDMELKVYYEVIQSEYSIDVNFDNREINLQEDDKEIHMKINIKNTGNIKVDDKNLFIILPPELKIKEGYNSYSFNLDIGEDIGETCPPLEIIIEPNIFKDGFRTGWYDVLVICDDKIISNEVLVRGNIL